MARRVAVVLLTGLLGACSSAASTPDSGGLFSFDAGQDHASTASSRTDSGGKHSDGSASKADTGQPQHDGSASKTDASDASVPHDGAIRTATTRSLLPTSVDSVLIDPFVTSDMDWGHFRAVVPATAPDASITVCGTLNRQFLSASPVGVSAPTLVATAAFGCTEILAPFSGGNGTDLFHADVWVSLADANGVPVPLPASLDTSLTVALLPNTLPNAPPAAAYPLTAAAGSTVTLADGSQWVSLALASSVSLPMGGWFAIQIVTPSGTVRLAGPELVPTTAVSLVRPSKRAITASERAAIATYASLAHKHPSHRR